GLSHDTVHDCNWLGRHLWQRLYAGHAIAPELHTRAYHRLHFRRVCRRVRPLWRNHAAGAVWLADTAWPGDCGACAHPVRTSPGRLDGHDVFCLCICEHGDGHGDLAGGGRSLAVHELWRDGSADIGNRLRIADEYQYVSARS